MQVRNLWCRQWDLFKAVRRRQDHTGGGDADEREDDSQSEVDEEAAKDDVENGEKVAKDGKHLSAKKRLAALGAKKPKFSQAHLDDFENSEWFRMIDQMLRFLCCLLCAISYTTLQCARRRRCCT